MDDTFLSINVAIDFCGTFLISFQGSEKDMNMATTLYRQAINLKKNLQTSKRYSIPDFKRNNARKTHTYVCTYI